jgi:DNA-binding LacI/PurR family transcriptional regulator
VRTEPPDRSLTDDMTRHGSTVRDIASVAGVSAASVSRALRDPSSVSDRTRQLVRGALVKLESGNASGTDSGLPTIGCLFADATSGPRFGGFDSTIWAGVARAAMSHGTEVLLLNIDRRAAGETVGEMIRRRGIGALAVRADERAASLLDEIAEAGIPTIVVAHQHDHPGIGYIRVASRETSRDAVSHLIHLGHRRIAFCRNIVTDQDHANRAEGYRDALRAHGIDHDPSLEIAIPADAEGGITAIDRLLAMPDHPTAAYFADPLPTIGALRRLHELSVRVPADFSVVGFDDDNTRVLGTPVYTAVCQDAPALGLMTGQMLCRLMRGTAGGPPPRIDLESYFEVNQSTGPAPARGA